MTDTKAKLGSASTLGIDIGTSGIRCAAIDADGNPVDIVSRGFDDGSQSREPRQWAKLLTEALAALSARLPLDDVQGVAVNGTSGTLVGLDQAGEPVGQASLYSDRCDDPKVMDAINSHAPESNAALGATSPLARAIGLQRAGATRIVHQADWLAAVIAGTPVGSDENNALKTGYDLTLRAWPDWLEAAGMDRALLPDVRQAGAAIVPLGELGKRFGLPATCMLHAGTTDGCAAFLATGASAVGDAVTSLGSTLVVKLASSEPIESAEFGIYSHRVGPFWLAGGASNSGGAVLQHYFSRQEIAELSLRIEPDRDSGYDYYPLIEPGERFPFSDSMFMPRLTPRPDDAVQFLHGMMEGIATIEALGYRKLCEIGAGSVTSIRTVGGGAVNPVWHAIRSRVLNVPLVPPHSVHAAVGTARLVQLSGSPS